MTEKGFTPLEITRNKKYYKLCPNRKLKTRFLTGFTIIELIVVIAIISVLSTIVLVNVTGYIGSSRDAALKGSMNSLPSGATIYFEEHGNYGAYCNEEKTELILDTIANSAGKPRACGTTNINEWNICCKHSDEKWTVCAQLISNLTKAWCIDYTGARREISNSNCKTSKLNSGCPQN